MAEANQSRFGLTLSDFDRYDWREVIAASKEKQCEMYHYDFGKKARERETAGDSLGQKVFAFLGTICSFHANYDSTGNPFQPLWRNGDQRALMAEDLVETDLDVLAALLPSLDDAELRARVADILWECRRDHESARVAITAYLASASHLRDAEFWTPAVERLERALQLSAKLAYGKALFTETATVLERVLKDALDESGCGLKAARLMDVLIAFRVGDDSQYAKEAERIAEELEKSDQWDFAEEYWWVASRWHRRSKRENDSRRCDIRAAETMISKAEANLVGPTPSYMFAAHWLSRGFEALRQARAPRERSEAIHVRLLEVQELSTSELKAIEFDPSQIPGFSEQIERAAEDAKKHVTGEASLKRFSTWRLSQIRQTPWNYENECKRMQRSLRSAR